MDARAHAAGLGVWFGSPETGACDVRRVWRAWGRRLGALQTWPCVQRVSWIRAGGVNEQKLPSRCTGIAAVWCPIHGDCSCPRHSDGERDGDSEDCDVCPLHGLASAHGDEQLRHNRHPSYCFVHEREDCDGCYEMLMASLSTPEEDP